MILFAKCRSPGIYKQDYLNELYTRYDEASAAITAPPKPQWSYEEGDTSDTLPRDEEDGWCMEKSGIEDNGQTGTGPMAPSSSSQFNGIVKTPQFMDGKVPGVEYEQDGMKRKAVQKLCQEFCSFRGCANLLAFIL